MRTTLFTVTLKLQKLQPHSHERRNSQSHERNCFNSLRLRLSLASLSNFLNNTSRLLLSRAAICLVNLIWEGKRSIAS
ncbi:hypothetical protein P8452_57438 [Trifolium repens]|nr:hypothetical protein P8452_42406 [Trifolium repens]WJX73684.1 hypothetical protein P8452_57438 [Trifolium repens]